jgi:hypothetical protein
MTLTFVTSVTHNTSVTPKMCHIVSQYDTMTQKSSKLLEKMQKIQKNCRLRKKIDVSHYDTLTRLCHRKS